MLYDLNVPWTPTTSTADLERTISFLSELGYHTLALTHSLSANNIPPQITNPIPLPSALGIKIPPKTTLLRRLTLTLSDPTQNHRLSTLAAAYDILALRPTTEKAYLAACNSVTDHSIISLDLTQRYPFHWKPKPCMTAVNRGVRFEICYAQATGGNAEARRNFISNLTGIVRVTKGRGLVVSGEARDVLGVRGLADVLNLLGVWGLGRERGVDGMGVNPRGVVVNEGIKRSGFRGVVDDVEGGERVVERKGQGEKEKGCAQGIGKNEKGKRKAEQEGADGTPISKRQKKRMKLQALKAEKQLSQKGGSSMEVPTSKDVTPSKDTSTPDESDTPSTIKAKANG
jgi:ribonuclease P/MRP protein subunit RPP1